MRNQGYYILIILLLILLLALMNPVFNIAYAQISPPTPTPFGMIITAAPLPTATVQLTPYATSAAPGCEAIYPNLAVGDVIAVVGGINIRATPTINGPLMGQTEENWIFYVVDGPICANNYLWWGVNDGGDLRGWVAERNIVRDFIIDTSSEELKCAAPLQLVKGESLHLVSNVRVRATPTLDGRVLTVAPVDAVAEVLDAEVVCRDGYIWRNIRVQVLGYYYDGWIAEGSRADYSALYYERDASAITQCYEPQLLAIGDLGRIGRAGTPPRNMRAEPGLDGAIIHTLLQAVPIEIIGGPVCLDGLNWWQVQTLSNIEAIGWVAEGARGQYVIRPFDERPPQYK